MLYLNLKNSIEAGLIITLIPTGKKPRIRERMKNMLKVTQFINWG